MIQKRSHQVKHNQNYNARHNLCHLCLRARNVEHWASGQCGRHSKALKEWAQNISCAHRHQFLIWVHFIIMNFGKCLRQWLLYWIHYYRYDECVHYYVRKDVESRRSRRRKTIGRTICLIHLIIILLTLKIYKPLRDLSDHIDVTFIFEFHKPRKYCDYYDLLNMFEIFEKCLEIIVSYIKYLKLYWLPQ